MRTQDGGTSRSSARIATSLALVLLLAVPTAQAAIDIDGVKRGQVTIDPSAVDDVRVTVRLVLDEPAVVYAKLLPTSWSAVNDGEPNGTVAHDRASGVDGWWVAFRFLDLDGNPLGGSETNETRANGIAFHTADGTPTPALSLPGGIAFLLETSVHFPDAALEPGARHEASWSIAGRPGTGPEANASGASRDPSVAYTLTILVPENAVAFERVAPAPAPAKARPPPAPASEPGRDAPDAATGEAPAPLEATSDPALAPPEGFGPAVIAPLVRDHDSHYWILVLLACILVALLLLLAMGAVALYLLAAKRRDRTEEEPARDGIAGLLNELERDAPRAR